MGMAEEKNDYFSDNWMVGTNKAEGRLPLPLVHYFSTHSLLSLQSKLLLRTYLRP